MKSRLLQISLLLLFPLCMMAQGEEFSILKGDCMPEVAASGGDSRPSRRALVPITEWDATKTYKQMVVLLSFADNDFTVENPKEYYGKLFNEPDFHERQGVGCVADYFRDQSGDLCHLKFDIYGPVKVSEKAQPYENPTQSTKNYGLASVREALLKIIDANPSLDYTQYDWNQDGTMEQVVFVCAGPSGNSEITYGYLWPVTTSFSTVTTPDNIKISRYSASTELFPSIEKKYKSGIGTICHEFSHCLGLPDIYPVPARNEMPSIVDEWDLMDGGNFTNWGWCPPNYSPLEKMLMGWLTPVELTEPASITEMKPVSEGGEVYMVRHTDTEYLLLENRQWVGWDKGTPGKGLVIYHVNYDQSVWENNRVNNFTSEENCRYRIVHADNMDYNQWEAYVKASNLSSYAETERMHRRHLSTSPYPLESNTEMTDQSTPAAKMQTKNTAGESMLSKPITNIKMSDDGLISFDFMGGTTGINDLRILDENGESCIYDLSGKRVYIPFPGRMYIIKKNGVTKKYVMTP